MEEMYFEILANTVDRDLTDGYDISDLNVLSYDYYGYGNFVELGNMEFLIVVEDELDPLAVEYTRDSLWTYAPSFLSNATGEPAEVFERLAEMCEGGNSSILSIVENTCGVEELTEKALRADGYGLMLSPYDGYMYESSYGDDYYYIFRMN